MIEFIFGAAGSGKTYAMVEEIRAELARDPEGPALIWLLPEQATFPAETALLAAPGPVGATRVHVLSFKSLALRVREHQGAPDKPLLSAVGRLFLLSRVYARAAPALAVFPREMRRGDLEHLTALLAELAGRVRRTRNMQYPTMPATIEPTSTPIRAASAAPPSPNASSLMKSDIVKPMPPRQET